ncbi:MAG TPA: hypothetical protein VNM22_20125 [Candidatus Limnocylindrales bacterium]|nr:hypothetical protein [Candidatus Limnocylindrales bacterium]
MKKKRVRWSPLRIPGMTGMTGITGWSIILLFLNGIDLWWRISTLSFEAYANELEVSQTGVYRSRSLLGVKNNCRNPAAPGSHGIKPSNVFWALARKI